MRAGTTLGLALLLSGAVSTTVLAQTTSPWPDSPAPAAQPAQPAPAAATPTKPATAAKRAKPAAKRTAAKPAPAAAATPPLPTLTADQAGALKFTCSKETASLCQGAAAGTAESYVCLQGKTDQLSTDCRTSVMAVEEANTVEVDPDAPAAAAPAAHGRAQRPQQAR